MSSRTLHQLCFRHRIDAFAVDTDDAGIGLQQSEDHLEDDRLSDAARPQQHGQLARGDGEADVTQHDVIVEGQRDALELHSRRVRVARSPLMAGFARPRRRR